MKIIIDTNFIISCIKKKIDFFNIAEEIFDEKAEWLIPEEVLNELEKVSKNKNESYKDREAAKLGIKILIHNNIQTIKLNNKNTDKGIIDYARKINATIATLDKGIKRKTDSKILTIRGIKNLEAI